MSAHIARAWKLYELHRYAACIDAAQQHLAVVPNDSEAYRLIAHAAVQGGRPQEALAAAQQAVALAPADANVHLAWAVANHIAGKRDAADAAIGEALRLNPQDAKSHEQLARQTVVRQRWTELVTVARNGLAHDPCNDYLLFAQALASSQAVSRQIALQQIEQGLSINPENADLVTLKGALLVEKGNAGDGIPHLLDALRIAPDSEYARVQLGIARSWRYYVHFHHFRGSVWLVGFTIFLVLMFLNLLIVYISNGFSWR